MGKERTDHANEDVGSGIEWFYGGRAHTEMHNPRNLTHYDLHQTPVVQYTNNRTEVNNNGKYLQKETENYHTW